jgi:hypothetical protein
VPISNREAGDYQIGDVWYTESGRKKLFSFDYAVTIDATEYERIAIIVRWLIFAGFIFMLFKLTNSLIGRG